MGGEKKNVDCNMTHSEIEPEHTISTKRSFKGLNIVYCLVPASEKYLYRDTA